MPVAVSVATRPDVEREPGAVCSQLSGEGRVRVAERTFGADVDPDRGTVWGVSTRERDQVVVCEIRRFVERALRCVGATEPQRRGVTAHRAEPPGRDPPEVEG